MRALASLWNFLAAEKTGKWLCVALLTGFALIHLAVAVPFAGHDTHRDQEWRFRIGAVDDALNAQRLQAVLEKGYAKWPFHPAIQQFNLLLHAGLYRLLHGDTPMPETLVVQLRLGNTFLFVGVIFALYFLLRTWFSPWIAFWPALFFVIRGDGMIRLHGKEDSLCLLLTLGAVALFNSYRNKPRPWKLGTAAIVIGLGGATKLYPLALGLVFVPVVLALATSWPKRIALLTAFAATTIVTFYLVNPHFYLGESSPLVQAQNFFVDDTHRPEPLNNNGEATGSVEILWQMFFWRHKDFWCALALLGGVCWLLRRKKRPLPEPSPLEAWLWKYRWWVGAFIVVYYGGSLYKISGVASARYLMLGELLFAFALALTYDALARLPQPFRRYLFPALLFGIACGWSAFQFNHTRYLALLEEQVRNARFSSFDEVEGLMMSYPDWESATYLVTDRKVLNREKFKVFETKETGEHLLRESHASYALLNYKVQNPVCVRPFARIVVEGPKTYSFFPSALVDFYRTLSGPRNFPADRKGGLPFFIYEAKGCWEKAPLPPPK